MQMNLLGRQTVIPVVTRRNALICGCMATVFLSGCSARDEVIEREAMEVIPPRLELLQDDKLEDREPVFSPTLVDSRLLDGPGGRWEINASEAVTKLDIVEPRGGDTDLLELYSSYVSGAQKLRGLGYVVLPSINSIDGKAKQFDDGLMAAVMSSVAPSPNRPGDRLPRLLKSLLRQVSPGTDAYAWVYAALEIGDYLTPEQLAQRPERAATFVSIFNESANAKPLAFYSWTPDLERIWRFVKFLQQPVDEPIASMLRGTLSKASLVADYRQILGLLARISNPPAEESLLGSRGRVFLPPMGTKESELIRKLFGASGIPPNVELMQEFVKAIRSGQVDMAPKKASGWYDYQVHALETFLLPERGKESQKLLLTKHYKQRMLEGFKALLTKRLETHAGMARPAAAAAAPPPPPKVPEISPRLRVEPNPTYYLRMARSYAFMEQALKAFLGPDEQHRLFGLREGGLRDQPLLRELAAMKDHFYGLHLIACEDIGMEADLREGELADPMGAKARAEAYLGKWEHDRDLAADTRVCVPVAVQNDQYRLWCSLGVKGIKLVASYARPPRGRVSGSQGDWRFMEKTTPSTYLLLADEFGEVSASVPLNRMELRAIADREKTKDRILQALAR